MFQALMSELRTLVLKKYGPPPAEPYAKNLQPMVVPVSDVGYPELQCWMNALRYCLANSGWRPLFGWAVWAHENGKPEAQHHAVVALGEEYLDVTPNPHSDEIMFVPDDRVVFDYEKYRFPPNVSLSSNGSVLWWYGDKCDVRLLEVSLTPQPEEIAVIAPLIARAKAANII
jgi:hypothetical protein